MRATSKTFETRKTVVTTEQAVNEFINTVFENKTTGIISVQLVYLDVGGNFITSEDYFIQGDDYNLLMQANPDFAPGKPENEYREVDLFYMIDLIASRT